MVSTVESSFVVLKQIDNKGPIYKVELCSKTFKVLIKEKLNGVPTGWSVNDFCILLDKGKNFDIDLIGGE
ncbi:hypothetical protein [Metabacillus fastidiosus]|uniref:hypothetical protein n=1 Tax=Metabacillus fastidiosus TaxID=1458 RepID=UPI002E1C97EB|nr:hypothetical protein [Metabacillus fastidiosus]